MNNEYNTGTDGAFLFTSYNGVIPEPSTGNMLLLGLVGIALHRRPRR